MSVTSDPEDGVLRVLQDAAPEELHWTVVLDRALRGGHVEPTPVARDAVQKALASLVSQGRISKTSKGTYRAG